MNSPAVFNDIALTKQLADGTIEWVTLQNVAQLEPAVAGVSYTLIDRGRSYEAPQSLRLERRGDNLIVRSEGAELLIVTDFFAVEGTSFYPQPDVASGAGPFSGPEITPDTESVRESSDGPLIVWLGGSDASGERAEQEAATVVREGGISPWVWVGGGLALLGIAGAAGGGGGGGGDDTPAIAPAPPPPPPPEPSDTTPPQITSSETAEAIDENSSAGQVVYSAAATDAAAVTWSLTGADAEFFSIDSGSGVVTLLENPDFETQPSYEFTVVATDAAGNQSQQSVSLAVNDLNDAAPRITSGATAATVDENSGAGQAIYTATAEGNVTWSLAAGSDSQLSINADNGVVTLSTNPDHETQSSFSFTVVATDADGNRSEQPVNLVITDLDEVAPTITSGAATQAIDENTGAGQLVYTATSTDQGDISSDPITYSLAQVGDAAAFSIDPISGAVTLLENPNFEVQPRYDFTVIATDGAGNSSQQSVSLDVNDLDDSAPFISSGAVANPIDENSGANQPIYIAVAEGGVTWSLDAGANSDELSIDPVSGVVTLTIDPDHETQADYTFTVIATDAAGNSSEQTVTLVINDLDEVAPTITSSSTADAINENTGSGQVVYTATSTDTGDISTGPIQYSLAPGPDAAAFSIGTTSGVVTLIENPDFEAQSSYEFTVVATDAAGNSTQQLVSLAVNDIDENAPPITSGATAVPIDENSGANQAVYTATAGEAVTWSLAPGGDAGAFSIDAVTGEVTLLVDPDHETDPSYAFIVVATNEGGNSSQQVVSLAVNDLDEVAPTITSAPTADAIDENSGANQIVYRATSTDTEDISTGSTTYSLAPIDDGAAFSINATTGVVRLLADPDFEVQSSYMFTVVATDAAGNSSEQAVTLDINDVDETQPSVVSVVLSDALGAENNVLNAGDTVQVTVTLDRTVSVDVTSGTPQISLTIGSATVVADFVTGGGPDELLFEYVVQAGDNDGDGISIPANAIIASGALIADVLDNVADLDHAAVADNDDFLVDTEAPTLASSNPADDSVDVLIGANIVLTFAEAVTAAEGNITISNGADTLVIDVTDESQVDVNGAEVTINPVDDLDPNSTYNVQVDADAFLDIAGNGFAGISDAQELNFDTEIVADPSVVVFDLIGDNTSSHSDREFDPDVSYDIYILVDSNSDALATINPGQRWSGAGNLGSDDRIILVGDGADVEGPAGVVSGVEVGGNFAAWQTADGATAARFEGFLLDRTTATGDDTARLFAESPDDEFFSNQGSNLATRYLTELPAGILTSQGLV